MPTSDQTQDLLRDAYQALVEHAPDPPEFDEFVGWEVKDFETPRQAPVSRGLLVAAASATLVLVIVLLPTWFRDRAETASVPMAMDDLEWSFFPFEEFGDLELAAGRSWAGSGVAKFGDEFVLVPSDCNQDDCRWAVSSDGVDWRIETVPLQPPEPGLEYLAWGEEGTIWFVQESTAIDPGTPQELKVIHNEGEAWVEDTWELSEEAKSRQYTDHDGFSVLQSLGFGNCMASFSTDAILLDVIYGSVPEGMALGVDGVHTFIEPPGDDACAGGIIDSTVYVASVVTAYGGTQALYRLSSEREWVRLDQPAQIDAPIQSVDFAGDRVFVHTITNETWTTTDFEVWEQADTKVLENSKRIIASEVGWLGWSDGAIYASRNGTNWTRVPSPDFGEQAQQFGAADALGYVDGLLVVGNEEGVWIGRSTQ